jgi:uracil-DNA glycosylase
MAWRRRLLWCLRMGELLNNLRQLVELDRGLGVEFMGKPPLSAAPATVSARPVPPPPRLRTTIESQAPAAPVPAADGTRPALPAMSGLAAADLAAIAASIAQCTACGLCSGRKHTVPGEGSSTPELVFVGEGPGADEDASGRPFVGAAGQLLDRMIAAMGISRTDVFIGNVVKCRPPGNRAPEPDEAAACMPFLEAQLTALQPKVICTLGATPLKAMLGLTGITRVHGQRQAWRGIPVIPTFHPAYLLRNPEAKKPAWADLLVVLDLLGRKPPART